MWDVAPRVATYEDLLALPEDVRAEVLDGRVITSPAPLPKHSSAQRALGSFVARSFDDDRGLGEWWSFLEVDIQLSPRDIVRPDLASWRRERLRDPGDLRPIRVAPDWVCEVLSSSAAAQDRMAKRALYARSGVRHYWTVDVEANTLEAFELAEQRWVLIGTYGDDAVVRIAPLDAIELAVGQLFRTRKE